MARSKSLKVTRSPVVESKFVLVHTSRKTYRRLVTVRRTQNSQATPTPHPRKQKAKRLVEIDLSNLTLEEEPEVEPFQLFSSTHAAPVVPNVSDLLVLLALY
jgi:hypothetical protein